jgi:hypothetical protein
MARQYKRKVNVVEVGLGFGDFASYLVQSCPEMVLRSVESWQGKFMRRQMKDCRDEVMARMEKFILSDYYDYGVIEKSSQEASEMFTDGSLDVVYIDADHSYRGVKSDVNYWFKKIESGGLFCGHDYKEEGVPGVKRAVDEFAKKYGLNIQVTEDVNPNPSWFALVP